MNSALEVQGLCKRYQDFSLRDVSFSLPTGFIMGFVGQNGAGKTTTIRLILNMAERSGGTIKVFGLDNITDEQTIKQDVAVVLDDTFFVGTWTVGKVEQALKGFYTNWSSEQYGQWVKRFGLSLDKQVKDLSRGMKMKLMLAVALSHDAKLLILDEPTSGLDPVARDELLDALSAYIADGERSILFSTHITSDLEKIADYITLLRSGKVFYTGTKDHLFESFYLVKGGPDDLQSPLREKLIGLSVHGTGFAGLLPAADVALVAAGVVADTPTIDDILVCISREAH